ncbi:MAG TPA: threonine synthase, partial [Flavisolibacter sp.]|nr:threonine synthase [Flavisolibacter sp.]
MDIQDITISRVAQLACSACGQTYAHDQLLTFATCCNKPLLVNYDLEANFSKEVLKNRPTDMWRYREVLPLLDEKNKVSL